MIIGFLKENDEFETRSMLLPEHVSQISNIGLKVLTALSSLSLINFLVIRIFFIKYSNLTS